MTLILVDTNVWARRYERNSPLRPIARQAVTSIRARGDEPVLAPQTLYELWVVLTRLATARGGFGFSSQAAAARLDALLRTFPLLPDTSAIMPTWLDLVRRYDVAGVGAHDARLVAAMKTHGLTHILTFNGADFARYAPEGITPLDPQTFH